jgi:D-tyrosyl-tRNA(Tyr) deacylase
MKAVVQRVIEASVTVGTELKGCIAYGLLVYLGVTHDDSTADADWLAEKIVNLRIFDDAEGKMNLSLVDIVNHNVNYRSQLVNKSQLNHSQQLVNESDVNQEKNMVNTVGVLAISQFTLLGDARKGRRPSWGNAAPPEQAKMLYEYFIEKVRSHGLVCESGEFQAKMMVTYTNDGPVTILLDSKQCRE